MTQKILFYFLKVLYKSVKSLWLTYSEYLGGFLLFMMLLSSIIPFILVLLLASRRIKLALAGIISSLSFQMLFSWLLFITYHGSFVSHLKTGRNEIIKTEVVTIPLNFLPNSIEVSWILLQDTIGSSFVILTSFIMLLCFVYLFFSPRELFSPNQILLLLMINFSLINFFLAGDLFFFCFSFMKVFFFLFFYL